MEMEFEVTGAPVGGRITNCNIFFLHYFLY